MEKEITNFYKFREDIVINTFGINRIQECNVLLNWIQADDELDDFELKTLDKALNRYFSLADAWNEEELKMHFISTIFNVANPNIPNICKTYFENGNIKISGSLYIPAHQFEDKSIEGICILEKGKDNKSFVTVQDKLGINESIFKDSTGILLVSEIKNVDIKNRKLTLSVFDKREFADQSRVDAAFLDGKPSEDFEAFFRKHIRDVELDF